MQIDVRIDYNEKTWGGALMCTHFALKDSSDILRSRIKKELAHLPTQSKFAQFCAHLREVSERFFFGRTAPITSLLCEAISVCMKQGDEVTVLQHAPAYPYMRPLRQDEIWEIRRQIKAAHRLIFTTEIEGERWTWTLYPKKC